MIHPRLLGNTIDGSNSRENVARMLASGMLMNSEGWIEGPPDKIIQSPIPEAYTQAKIKPTGSILHSNSAPGLTPWQSLIKYWTRKDITGEAHFQVPLSFPGIQAVPVTRKADCNYKGNFFYKDGEAKGYVSFETADLGQASLKTKEWELDQLEFMISVNFLICLCYDAACSACPTPYSSGIDYHSKFKEWSIYTGKTCPGAARIRQMDYIRIEVANRLAEFFKQCGGKCVGT